MNEVRASSLRLAARWLVDSLTILGFLGAIAAPTLDHWVRPDDELRSPLVPELRTPAPRPALPATFEAVGAYPTAYEEYFKDSFGLRDRLLRWNSIVKVFGFGVSPSSEVFFGRDGWFFYNEGRSRDNHRGAFPFSKSELDHWARMLARKQAILESLGVRYLYVVAPDKESVYAELLPDYMRPIGPTRLDQWLAYLEEHAPQIETLDLRGPLIAAKRGDAEDEWIYTKLGTHWTGRGAQVALRAMLVRMDGIVRGFVPEEVDAFRRVEFDGKTGDSWATRMYIEDLLPMRIHAYVSKSKRSKVSFEGKARLGRVRKSQIGGSARPRMILMHDSFGPHIEQGLSEQCAYLECRWDNTLDVADIEKAAPAILVDLHVERMLNHIDPFKLVPTEEQPWPGRFDRSRKVLLAIDKSLDDWGLESLGGTLLGPAVQASRPRLPVVLEDPSDQVGLGSIAPVHDEVPVLHLCIDSPFATELTLSYRPEGEAEFQARNAYVHSLVEGPNDIYLLLDRADTGGELVLRPGAQAGTYLLRDLEIRSVPPL